MLVDGQTSNGRAPEQPPHYTPPPPGPHGAVVSDFTSILGNAYWSGGTTTGTPVFVTYSYESTAQDYLLDYGYSQAFIDSFQAFDAADKQLTQAALNLWGNASGIYFIEVPSGEGDIRFANYNFNLDPANSQFSGFAYYPWRDVSLTYAFDDQIGGDVFINTLRSNSLHLMLHEIGHAIGLKHPFDGDPTLAALFDNWSYSVMSYTSDGTAGDDLGTFDVQAVQYIYGAPNSDGSHLLSWSWNATTRVLTQVGTGAANKLVGTSGKDSVQGAGGDDLIAGFTGNDFLSGGDGSDSIFGGAGNDTLVGGAGNDFMYGGDYWGDTLSGIDTVDYSASSASVFVDLLNWQYEAGIWHHARGAAIGYDELHEIDNVIGTAFGDELRGDDGANVLDGGGQGDILYGGAGNDTLRGGNGVDIAQFSVFLSAATWTRAGSTWTVVSSEGTDLLIGMERLQFADQLIDLPGKSTAHSDLTGDGTSDIVGYHAATRSVGMFAMDSGTATWVGISNAGTGWAVTDIGDVTGDGTADIVWSNSATRAVGAYEMDSGSAVWIGIGKAGTGWAVADIGDITGDGTADIVWYNSSTRAVGAFEMDSGSAVWIGIGKAGTGWAVADIGDITGDGTADIVWYNSSTRAVGAFEMDSGSAVWTGIGKAGTGWTVADAGDFTGDGTEDILWYNATTRTVGMFKMDTGSAVWAGLGNAGTGWSVAGAGDYTGDGTDDILWENATSDAVGMFAMDSSTATWVVLGQLASGWDVV